MISYTMSYIMKMLSLLYFISIIHPFSCEMYSTPYCSYSRMFHQNIKLYKKMKLSSIYYEGSIKAIFNDPHLGKQWYFVRSDPSSREISHELDKVWSHGIYGKGITIGIIGARIESQHYDIKDNYNKELSFNFLGNSTGIYHEDFNQATIAAGLISAVANNMICGVGAAPLSSISSLQIIGPTKHLIDETDLSMALNYKKNLIHIYLLPVVSEKTWETQQFQTSNVITSLLHGIQYGRGYLGSLFIAGAGNYRESGNNCAFNGFLQRPEVLVFGSMSKTLIPPIYSEQCTAILAASISTSNINKNKGLFSTTNNNMCNDSASGSLASMSITAGILALLLSDNPDLSVRQIMSLIIHTSTQYDHRAIRNHANYLYSYSYGFGLLNAEKMIQWSRSDFIVNLAEEHQCIVSPVIIERKIDGKIVKTLYIYTSACLDYVFCVSQIEQVYLFVSIYAWKKYSLEIFLTSPRGTRLEVMKSRKYETLSRDLTDWRVKILGYFGESPHGVWKLEIVSVKGISWLTKVKLIFYGTCVYSSVNVISHSLVYKFICENFQYVNTKIYAIFCKPRNHHLRQVFNPFGVLSGIDILSFTDDLFPDIHILNNFK